tara:strand:- start:1197 stop:1508 length:312 start_codon:yes stop_codon:yes gene_type:complete
MINLYQEGNGFYGIEWNEELNSYTTHVILPEADEWTLSSFRKYKKVFKDAKVKMKSMGITSVLGVCASKKERKFNMLFGYKPVPDGIVLTEDGILNYLVKLEI